jgi:hypothetical protein
LGSGRWWLTGSAWKGKQASEDSSSNGKADGKRGGAGAGSDDEVSLA